MRKFFLFGYFGRNNFGDDLMLISLLKHISKTKYKKIVLSGNLNFSKKIKKFNTIIYPRNIFYFVKSLLQCSDFILAGGSWFHDNYRKNPDKIIYLIRILLLTVSFIFLRLFKKKVILLGVSIGPFKENSIIKLLTYLSLYSCNKILLRDKNSLNEIRLMNKNFLLKSVLGRDLVELISQSFNKKIISNKNYLGISIMNLEQFKNFKNIYDTDIYKKLAKRLNKILIQKKNLKIKVFALWTPKNRKKNDLYESRKFINLFNKKAKNRIELIEYKNDYNSLLKEMNKCKYMICTRLHSFLTSYYLKQNFNLIVYNRKCADAAKHLMISNKRLLFLNKINDESGIEKWFNYLINNNLKLKSEFDNNLIKKINNCLGI